MSRASVKHRCGVCSGSLRGELLFLWVLSSPLWSPDEPFSAVWSKEVIALWRKPQRPTRTIRFMCFWVTGAQLRAWYYCRLPSSGSGEEMAWLWLLPDAWSPKWKCHELVYSNNHAIDFLACTLNCIFQCRYLKADSPYANSKLCCKQSSHAKNAATANQLHARHMHPIISDYRVLQVKVIFPRK